MKPLLVSPRFQDIFTPNIEIGSFPDGESHIRIRDIEKYKNQQVVLCHRLYPSPNNALVELFLILGTLQKVRAKVSLLIPYLPYARQDKVFLKGESPSAEIICQLMHKSDCQKLVTFDCHFLKKEGEFIYKQMPIRNISLGNELLSYAKNVITKEKLEIVAPDEGARYLVENQGGKSMIKNRRPYGNGKINYRHIEDMRFNFNIKNKNILILDDMISTGSTMIKAVEKLKNGGALKVYCAATHGFFLGNSLNKLKSFSDGVFVSDTIPSPVSQINIQKKITKIMNEM